MPRLLAAAREAGIFYTYIRHITGLSTKLPLCHLRWRSDLVALIISFMVPTFGRWLALCSIHWRTTIDYRDVTRWFDFAEIGIFPNARLNGRWKCKFNILEGELITSNPFRYIVIIRDNYGSRVRLKRHQTCLYYRYNRHGNDVRIDISGFDLEIWTSVNRLFRLYSISIRFRNAKAHLGIKPNWSQSWKLKHCRWPRPSRKWMRSTFICLSLVLIKPVSAIVHVRVRARDEKRSLGSLVGYASRKSLCSCLLAFPRRGRWQLFPTERLIRLAWQNFYRRADKTFVRVFLATSLYVRIKREN